MDPIRMGLGIPSHDVARVVTNAPLLHSMSSCKCGNRAVDVTIYADHPGWEAACTACGVKRPGYVSHKLLGEGTDRRSSYLAVSPARRFEIFKRDGFRCIHCNQAAQRSGRTSDRLDAVFLRELGADYEATRFKDSSEHAKSCMACGQMLPGIYQSIPYSDYARLSPFAKSEIDEILDAGRLTIDHLLPASVIEIDGVVREGSERKLVSRRLLVTSCYGCNWGRHDVVEPLDDILAVLATTVFKKNPRELQLARGDLTEIHLRASLQARKLKPAI